MTASDVLSTSNINSLVDSFSSSEIRKSVDPLTTKKTKYQNLVSQYGTFSSKMSAFKTITDLLKNSNTDSVFKSKLADVPTNNYFTASASSTLQRNSFSLRVLQLAKSDMVFSNSMISTLPLSATGTNEILFKTGNGSGGEYSSHFSVTLGESETVKTAIDKFKDAVLNDKADVISSGKNLQDSYTGGDSQFKVIISDTEYVINISGAATYDDVLNQTITQLSGITGLTVSKKDEGGVSKLSISLSDNSKDLTIKNTSGFDLVSDLNIKADHEKSAYSTVSLSSFMPDDSHSRLSVSSAKSGLDYRIKEISDINGGSLLTQLGMNFGTSRTPFDQQSSPDGSGFLYSDINTATNVLNSKFELNGILLQRNSNIVNNAIDGLTLNFKGVMKSDELPITFTTGTDTTTIRSKIDSFISKFNDLFTFSSKPDSDTKNDSNFNTVKQVLSQTAFSTISNSGDINSLSKIGISFIPGTGLSVSNSDLLNKTINETPEQIEKLFTSSGGFAASLSQKIEPYLGNSGIINRSMTSFNSNITWLNDKITTTQTRIDKSAETLRRRYQDLQVQVASLLSAQGYF